MDTRPEENSVGQIMQDLNEAIYCLQFQLQKLNHNLDKLQGHQVVVSNICEVLVEWSEKSPFLKQQLRAQLKGFEKLRGSIMSA